MSKRKKPRRLRKLTTRKALHVVAEEFRALEPDERPAGTSIGDPATLRVSIVRRWLHRRQPKASAPIPYEEAEIRSK